MALVATPVQHTGTLAPDVQHSVRHNTQITLSAFILAITVALLQPTNPLFEPTLSGTHLPERPCNGQHNTGWPLRHVCESASTIIMHR